MKKKNLRLIMTAAWRLARVWAAQQGRRASEFMRDGSALREAWRRWRLKALDLLQEPQKAKWGWIRKAAELAWDAALLTAATVIVGTTWLISKYEPERL